MRRRWLRFKPAKWLRPTAVSGLRICFGRGLSAGQGRYEEALPHARIADSLLNQNAVSPGAKKAGAEAKALLLELSAKTSH